MIAFLRPDNSNNDKRQIALQDHHWSRILREIERGDVVPVIGSELLEIEHNGKSEPLYHLVAREVVARLGIDTRDLQPPWTLCELVYLHREMTRDPFDMDLYHVVHDILSEATWRPSPTLAKLAAISHFDLFVTTTPDDLMVTALDQARSVQAPDVVSYAPGVESSDLPFSFNPDNINTKPVVFKLFGDAAMRPDFAITEEDILKYVHHLHLPDERPSNLFDVMRKRSLMMLGCSFENWLIRFILCTVKGDALFSSHGARGIVADRNSSVDRPLIPFLSRNRTLLYGEGDAARFIDELHKRWSQAHPESTEKPTRKNSTTPDSDEYVFISYAHEDARPAIMVRDALEKLGITVWLDKGRLEGGEIFEDVIMNKISGSLFFLPLISKNTRRLERGRWFRIEWNHAAKIAKTWPDCHPFIQPLIIDDSPIDDETIPDEFKRRHCSSFKNGEPDPGFCTSLVRNLRRYQQRAALLR